MNTTRVTIMKMAIMMLTMIIIIGDKDEKAAKKKYSAARGVEHFTSLQLGTVKSSILLNIFRLRCTNCVKSLTKQ